MRDATDDPFIKIMLPMRLDRLARLLQAIQNVHEDKVLLVESKGEGYPAVQFLNVLVREDADIVQDDDGAVDMSKPTWVTTNDE